MVALHPHALQGGAPQRVEVVAQERDPRRVLDDAVDQTLVVERRAVLGDPDLEIAVVGAQSQQQVVETQKRRPASPSRSSRPRAGTVSASSGSSADSRTHVGL